MSKKETEETEETEETNTDQASSEEVSESKLVRFSMNVIPYRRDEIHLLPAEEANKYLKSGMGTEVQDPNGRLKSVNSD